jgi:hypothetical protein
MSHHQTSVGPNPMTAMLRLIQSNQQLREELWRDPRGLITRVATAFPADVVVEVFRDSSGKAYFQASLPRDPEGAARTRQRMSRCPIARVKEADLVADPAGQLAPFGIRVPDDVEVTADDDYLRLRVPLHE